VHHPAGVDALHRQRQLQHTIWAVSRSVSRLLRATWSNRSPPGQWSIGQVEGLAVLESIPQLDCVAGAGAQLAQAQHGEDLGAQLPRVLRGLDGRLEGALHANVSLVSRRVQTRTDP